MNEAAWHTDALRYFLSEKPRSHRLMKCMYYRRALKRTEKKRNKEMKPNSITIFFTDEGKILLALEGLNGSATILQT